jgi:hypothetical protein
MFVAAMAIVFPVEIVVFSPARRASRKLLERMHEACAFKFASQLVGPLLGLSCCALQFVTLLDMGHRIVEYNQENLRIETLEGGLPGKTTSLIRSFPSKVSVRSRTHVHTSSHTRAYHTLISLRERERERERERSRDREREIERERSRERERLRSRSK